MKRTCSNSTSQSKCKLSNNRKGQEHLTFQKLEPTSTYAFGDGLECRVHGLRRQSGNA